MGLTSTIGDGPKDLKWQKQEDCMDVLCSGIMIRIMQLLQEDIIHIITIASHPLKFYTWILVHLNGQRVLNYLSKCQSSPWFQPPKESWLLEAGIIQMEETMKSSS